MACPINHAGGTAMRYTTSHGIPTGCSFVQRKSMTDVQAIDKSNSDEDLDDVASPREEVLKAQALNKQCGHENHGFLSFTHGFAPRITQVTSFPPEFEAWNALVEELPALVSSKKLRAYCEDESKLPLLDAKQLPGIFALRAASVLGYVAHAYWNMEEHPANKPMQLPRALEEPWRVVSQHHLHRKDPLFLGFFEHMVSNFQFEKGKVPPPVEGTPECEWMSDELQRYGCVEYNPAEANIFCFYPAFSLSHTEAERNFYGVLTEAQLVAAPAVKLTVEMLEAAEAKDVATMKRILEELLEMLTRLTFDSLNKIQQQRKAPGFVDATLFGKVIAPVPVPISSTKFGPSGTASPIPTLMDILFRRDKFDGFIGEEITHLWGSFPRNWMNFLRAVRKGPNLLQVVDGSEDVELQGLFGACLQQWAGENGFLGRHRLKMVGYIEVGMKLGRPATIGGFQGLLKQRGWDQIQDHLKHGQDQRFDVPLQARGLNNVGTIVLTPDEKLENRNNKVAFQVRIDITGSGIRYAPGSHVGILYQSRVEEVNKTLLAFADGDKEKAKELGETEVDLNDNWKSALRQRQEFHHTTRSDDSDLPTRLKLKKFLEFGELRPATRRMLELAHNASKSKDIQKILNEDLQAALTFSDIVTILMRDGVDLLKNGEENAKRRESLYVVNAEIDAIEQNMRKVRGIGRRTLTSKDRKMIFKGTDLTEDEQEKLNIRSGSADAVRAKVKDVKKVVPKLCELIEPAKFRYYSVASSPDVHPNEIHIFSHHLKYETKSAVSQTSPLLADTEPKVHRRGAASDYIVSKSLPRYFLAIEAIAEMAGMDRTDNYVKKGQHVKFHLNKERRQLLQDLAHLTDEEIDAILKRAKDYGAGGETLFPNIIKAIEEEMKGKPDLGDKRDRKVVLKVLASPRFRLPKKPVPCIMIAGGTGLAPFRSFWQHLALLGRPKSGEKHLLIIGVRSRESLKFENELLRLVEAGIMDVEVIFSRDECRFVGSSTLRTRFLCFFELSYLHDEKTSEAWR